MDELIGRASEILFQYGLAGLVIIGLAFMLKTLFRLYHEAQMSRISEGRDAVKALEANTNTLRELIDVTRKSKAS